MSDAYDHIVGVASERKTPHRLREYSKLRIAGLMVKGAAELGE
jgi:hypothetical protein